MIRECTHIRALREGQTRREAGRKEKGLKGDCGDSLQSSFFKYWVLTSVSDEEGGVYEARPLRFPPNWPIQRGWRGFDSREDGKFSYFTSLLTTLA